MGIGVSAFLRIRVVMDATDEVETLAVYRAAVENIEDEAVYFTKVVVDVFC